MFDILGLHYKPELLTGDFLLVVHIGKDSNKPYPYYFESSHILGDHLSVDSERLLTYKQKSLW